MSFLSTVFEYNIIGSLGRNGNFVQVENIHVSKIYLQGTTKGARIKTWQVLNQSGIHASILSFTALL
ncbi:hypothetical protein PRUPE_4G289600 [Prunus persica]|uniref:Uncharacterized protein n=1 Tax=Prunus persica TaxID=3760 RepID=M5X378_PRUPE|nr:hypothetical protein PRUPE_4G289600 [Prunus persica]